MSILGRRRKLCALRSVCTSTAPSTPYKLIPQVLRLAVLVRKPRCLNVMSRSRRYPCQKLLLSLPSHTGIGRNSVGGRSDELLHSTIGRRLTSSQVRRARSLCTHHRTALGHSWQVGSIGGSQTRRDQDMCARLASLQAGVGGLAGMQESSVASVLPHLRVSALPYRVA